MAAASSSAVGVATVLNGLPSLLLQAMIVAPNKVNEGRLVEAVALPWFDIIEHLKRDPGAAFQIPATKWEEIIAGAYKKAGFTEVVLTPRSGDAGRDVIATMRGLVEHGETCEPPGVGTCSGSAACG